MTQKFFIATLLIGVSTLALRAESLDDAAFKKLMKEVGGAAKRFKGGVESKDGAQVSKDAARVSEIYKQMAPFWKERKSDKGVKWSDESSIAAAALADSAKKGEWDTVKINMQGVMKNCKACHDAHREKLDDGGYRIK